MKLQSRARPGFTLLEMLVVMGIIALLASITVTAVFRLQSSQKESNTNTHLTKIQMAFDQQWKGAIDNIKKQNYPDGVRNATVDATGANNTARAKALHMKLLLRKEFPQTFDEARLSTNATVNANPYNDASMNAMYGTKTSITSAIGNLTPNDPHLESAVLLYMFLSQSRGGASQNPEAIARTDLVTIGNAQFRVLMDEWSEPIGFRRWAFDAEMNFISNELNSSPLVAPTALANYDHDDPDGMLKPTPAWAGYASVKQLFTSILPNVAEPLDGRNRGPFVVSKGRDKQVANDDDLYSFRLQQFRKGN
jgi:prepilin-type N-terminal cleavage/methylation domain-containing protein